MDKKEQILKLVSEYISEKHAAKTWTPGVDWVQYAGNYFDSSEYVSAIDSLLKEWLVLGEDAMKFEREFPPLMGKQYGIVTNSGSSSNLLMLLTVQRKYNLPKGTKVIVPVAGFPTTVNPIIQLGFEPVFVDIELETLNLNIDQVQEAVKSGAKILTFAHVLGNPPNMDKVMEIVDRNGLILLEDSCDALGSTYKGRLLGSYGIMSSCSFYPAHHMTLGEGGFVSCQTQELETIARSFREWGRGCYCVGKKANLSIKGTCGCRFKNWLPAFPDVIFDHKYIYDQIGYNLKPIELQCSIGLEQIKKLPEIHAARRRNHERLSSIFKPYEGFFHIHKATTDSDPSWFAFPITVRDGAPFKRSEFTRFMEEKKIQTRNYFGGNLCLQPYFKEIEWQSYQNSKHMGDNNSKILFPVATKITTDTLFLGVSPVITPEQLDYVEESVEKFFLYEI